MMSVVPIVRPYQSADASACALVFARAWHSGHPFLRRDLDQAVFEAETEGEHIFVVLIDDVVVGFVALDRPADFVHHLYVDPDWQGRGLGSELLRVAAASTQGRLSLKCLVANRRALAFYRREGWREAERGGSDFGDWVRMIAPAPAEGDR